MQRKCFFLLLGGMTYNFTRCMIDALLHYDVMYSFMTFEWEAWGVVWFLLNSTCGHFLMVLTMSQLLSVYLIQTAVYVELVVI